MESMGPTQKLQFPPQQDDDQENDGQQDYKRPRTDDNGEEIGLFFALVDRIRENNKMVKHKRPTFSTAEATYTPAGNIDANIIASKSRWKPSFVWEDFSSGDMLLGGKCGSSNLRDFASNSASARKEIQKPDIGGDNGRKVCSSDKHMAVGSFDLNAEAPSEHSVPSAL